MVAKEMTNKFSRKSHALRAIAKAQAESGDFNGASETTKFMKPNVIKALALRDISLIKTEKGNLNEALIEAKHQESPLDKIFMLVGIAEGLTGRNLISYPSP